MMTTSAKTLLTLVIALMAITAGAQSSDAILRDKITEAVMNVYDEQLAKEPGDYNTLFARAHQHYYNGDYTAALADLNQAMLLTPATDKDLRFDEHILRARISDARQDYASALADLRLAQEIQPKSLPCIDLIAKTNLKMGNLDAAEKAFKTILRNESMNYDAMYGLAQVYLARGKAKEAVEQVSNAVQLFRTEPQVYENRADIFTRLGDTYSAVIDLLQGMNVGNGGNAAQRLFDLSDSDYDGVMGALDSLAVTLPDHGMMFRYLRANIAMDHTRYAQALQDFSRVKRSGEYNTHVLYFHQAKCCLELARYDEALTYIGQALEQDPSQPEYYLVKALAQYHAGQGGNAQEAMGTLDDCAAVAPQYGPMLLTKAALLSSEDNEDEALSYLNAAVANDPDDTEARLARAFALRRLGNEEAALNDLNAVARFSDDLYDFRGFALSELGRDNEMYGWLDKVTKQKQPGGENFYYAAALMALRSNNITAMDYLRQAIEQGYGSLRLLRDDIFSPIGIKSLREEPDFQLLLEKAQPNFQE